jgi:predicted metalloprotease with PDZ domain
VHYRIAAPDPRNHLFQVTLTVAQPAAAQELSLPVWIPGSYLVREFASHLQGLQARQAARPARHAARQAPLARDCLPASRWSCATPCCPRHSVRTAWLDSTRGFFNGTSLCLRASRPERPAVQH